MPVTHVNTRTIPIDDLHPHPDNPNRGDVEAIAASLDEFGQYRAVVALPDGTILAGHHVVEAIRHRGGTEVRVDTIDTDPQTAKRIMLADNRIAELGEGLNPEQLLAVLESLDGDLAGTGYNDEFFEALQATLNPPEPEGDPDAAPPAPRVATRAKKGQAWRLGPHRLLVGDSTDTDLVTAWLGDDRADCVWTDPPYGVDYVGKTAEALTISNDGAGDLPELLSGAFRTIVAASRGGAPVYIAHADTERVVFETTARAAGLIIRQNLVWVKNTIVMGRSDYHYRHEPILYAANEGPADDVDDDLEVDDDLILGGDPPEPSATFTYEDQHNPLLYGFTPGGEGRLGRGGDRWYGDNKQATTFFVDKPAANRDHPTMKPVELIVAMLNNSCRPGGLVLDPFGGSGSTMAAAHITGRRAALIELDPVYAEVIIERYEALTGDTAEQE